MSDGMYLGDDYRDNREIGLPIMGRIEDLNCNTEATEHDKSKRIEDEDEVSEECPLKCKGNLMKADDLNAEFEGILGDDMYAAHAELVNRVAAIERKMERMVESVTTHCEHETNPLKY
jgi:hypothetical protein